MCDYYSHKFDIELIICGGNRFYTKQASETNPTCRKVTEVGNMFSEFYQLTNCIQYFRETTIGTGMRQRQALE